MCRQPQGRGTLPFAGGGDARAVRLWILCFAQRGAAVACLTLTFLFAVSAAEKPAVRQPLPSAEEIAKLPEDGGDEFNRLIFSQSPYRLQHARNPIDWYPWGEEAFAKAATQNTHSSFHSTSQQKGS